MRLYVRERERGGEIDKEGSKLYALDVVFFFNKLVSWTITTVVSEVSLY